MEKKMPTYRIVVNPEDETTGVFAVSLVDEPAIEVDWIKLSKEIEEFEFITNKDKQMLFGPLLIPNKMIYRKDNKGNEYNIFFDEETIQIIADKYNENKLNDVFNFQHSDEKVEAILLQNWITGDVDKSQEFGFSLPKGTWFGGIKVKNEKFWNEFVKTEKVKGFSVEIMAGTELVEMTTQVDKNKINLMEYKTKDGIVLKWEGDAAVDVAVFVVAADGTEAPADNGDYILEDGTTITIANGKVAEIKPVEVAPEEALAEPVATPTDAPVVPAFDIEAALNEMRVVIADLASRVDALENVETVEDETNNDGETAMMSKVKDLEDKIEILSSMAGAPTINKKDDRSIAIEDKQKAMLDRIEFLKNR